MRDTDLYYLHSSENDLELSDDSSERRLIYTVGHSTRTVEELIDILKAFSIELLVDIRTIPRSRKNPQFNKEEFKNSLETAGLNYLHIKELGGLRHPKKDSINTGWRNLSFRGYADYMQTDEFHQALSKLISLTSRQNSVIMCAEAVPWRCHRSLVADALIVRGFEVLDIFSKTNSRKHEITGWAVVEGNRIIYPASGRTF